MKKLILVILLIFGVNISFAQDNRWTDLPNSKARIIGKYVIDDQLLFGLELTIDKGWYIYSKDPSEFGIATNIVSIDKSKPILKHYWPPPHQKKEFNGYTSDIYQNQVLIPFAIKNIDNLHNLHYKISYLVCGESCIPVSADIRYKQDVNGNFGYMIKESIIDDSGIDSFAIMMLIALLGGIILNFMPCVLPVLSIKLMSIINNQEESKKNIRTNFISSSLGIIFSFILMSITISILISMGKNVGFGMHFQEPIFVITMIIMILLFGANLRGDLEINLPSKLNSIFLYKNTKSQAVNHFLSGMFACLLATPCSAPFVGTATGFALSQDISSTILIFTMMGIGFASPYIILAIFPGMIKFLPKPGAWMVRFKSSLGYLLYLSAMWLLLVLSHQVGVLPSLLLFGLILLLKFSLTYKSIKGALIIIALCYYVPFNIINDQVDYNNFIDSVWHNFEPEKIPQLVENGNVVIVDITASWCITCKFNKISSLDRPDVLLYLNHHKVYAMRADITNYNNIAQSYMKSFNRHGVPFNLVYGPKAHKPIILPELLSKSSLIKAINDAGIK